MTAVLRPILSVLALVLLAPGLATAQERALPPERALGLDAVASQCVSFVRIDFANQMCDRLAGLVADLAARKGVRHVHLGRTEWGFGSDNYLELPPGTGFINPAFLTFYIRATDAPNSAFIWSSLYVPVDPPARTGRLVLWEDSGIGAGDRGTISAGLAEGLAAKLEPVFDVLSKARPN